ncbi:MAG: hypothetical protein LBT89_08375 [Planctomycetaceae bacterium]|nr:hypothetical protein [Planctomycetaceae bacterium]
MFFEAKHLKEGGGAQDKQIKELIGIIQEPTNGADVFYGAFLDGVYSNSILKLTEENIIIPATLSRGNRRDTKLIKQQKSNYCGVTYLSEFVLV